MRHTAPLLILLVGCGIGDKTLLTELDSDQALKVCEEIAVEESVVTCGSGPAITVPATDVNACADALTERPAGCEATVGDFFACSDAVSAEDPCASPGDQPSCDPLFVAACLPL